MEEKSLFKIPETEEKISVEIKTSLVSELDSLRNSSKVIEHFSIKMLETISGLFLAANIENKNIEKE